MTQPDAPVPAPAAVPGFPPDDVVAGLLHAATQAPSMHNTQPWRFRVLRASQEIELYADPARALRFSDPHGRAVHIACGAALFNLRLAVLMAGREPVVRLFPDPAPHAPPPPLTLLATVRLAGIHHPGETDRELHAAIATRRTNRRPYSNRPVPTGVLGEMVAAARLEGAALHLPGQEETHRLLQLVADAEQDLLADPGYQAELARWVGGERDSDGIPASALGPRDPDRATPVRDFGTPTVDYEWFEETPQLAVLSTATSTPLGWLRAGQALQRVLLTATVHGIAASPLTQPLETADAWLVRDPRSGSESPQMILRLGYGLPVPAAPRRPIAEVLDEPDVR
jgi:nitroreductase